MFLSDQHSVIKGQDPEIKLFDLVGNAIKEWDKTESLRDEYSAKSLEEATKYDSLMASSMKPADLPQPQFTFQLDANGKVEIKFEYKINVLIAYSTKNTPYSILPLEG